MLQLCKRVGAFTVYFSTSEVYGPDVNPMEESEPHLRPNNRYGIDRFNDELAAFL